MGGQVKDMSTRAKSKKAAAEREAAAAARQQEDDAAATVASAGDVALGFPDSGGTQPILAERALHGGYDPRTTDKESPDASICVRCAAVKVGKAGDTCDGCGEMGITDIQSSLKY